MSAIDETATLPAAWYTDSSVLALEHERVYRASWQYAGPLERVAEPGGFLTFRAGRIPIVVTRAEDGSLNAFVNVCRHRGSEVVLQPHGRRKTLQCQYHAWTYGLDGKLRTAPGCEDEPGFERSEFELPRVAVDSWGPLVFVNPDAEAPALAEAIGELPQLLERAGLRLDELRLRRETSYDIAANWKVVVDNYLECYHCPTAHPSFSKLIDLSTYWVKEYDLFSVQGGGLKRNARDGAAPYRVRAGVEEGLYVFLWPNFTLNVYPGPGNVSVNLFEPLGEGRTRALYHYYFADSVPEPEIDEFVEFVDQIQHEDTALCESVQRGLQSGFFGRGRLILKRESALRHFQRLVEQALS